MGDQLVGNPHLETDILISWDESAKLLLQKQQQG